MNEIILVLRDSNKTNKATFEPDTLILNSINPEQKFHVQCENGYQVDDYLFMGKDYTIIDLGDNNYCARILPNKEITTSNKWFVNFSIVEE